MKEKIILLAILVFTQIACKKDSAEQPNDQALLQDGPLSAQLGKLIFLGENRYSRSTPFWGRNSDELFVTASTEILRVDFAAKKVEVIENSGGLVSGKTNENSGIIFLGRINNQLGYYLFNFSSNSSEKIINVPENQGTILHIAGNNIFYYQSPVSIPDAPCNGYCIPLPAPFVPATFYHLDKQTQQITDLENKRFMLFSPDGSKAILSSQVESRLYTFDNNSRTLIDSSDLTHTSLIGLFFHNGTLQSFETDVFGNITIKDFKTGQVLRNYQTNKVALNNFRVSRDGTKLYYSGGILNANSLQMLMYDITTNTEKIIAELPFLQGGSLPFDTFVLSDDNKKMVTQSGNDLYLKVID